MKTEHDIRFQSLVLAGLTALVSAAAENIDDALAARCREWLAQVRDYDSEVLEPMSQQVRAAQTIPESGGEPLDAAALRDEMLGHE